MKKLRVLVKLDNKMLLEIITRFHNSRNILEKRKLKPILKMVQENGYNSEHIYASIGEDSAAIQPNPNFKDLILLTTDAILPEFIKNSPYGAGFSSIYVGIDDIISCGGTPLACSTTIAYPNDKIGNEIFRGITDATKNFQIPLVRGHTTTDSKNLSLTSTIIGKSKIGQYLSASGSKENDFLAVIWDPDGEPSKANKNYWNTITNKNSKYFYKKRSFIKPAIENKYFSACKDISNGGILGTLYQMIEFSKYINGAVINLDELQYKIRKDKFQYPMIDFLFLFLTSTFLISGSEDDRNKVKLEKLVKKSGMRIYYIGKTSAENSVITLNYKNQKEILINIKK